MILDLKYIAKNVLVLSLTRELCSSIGFVFCYRRLPQRTLKEKHVLFLVSGGRD